MKFFHFFTGALVLGIMAASCSNHNTAQSTPVDTTNVNGTAPVTYAPDSPTSNPRGDMNSSADTGIRANNGAPQDSMRGNTMPPQH